MARHSPAGPASCCSTAELLGLLPAGFVEQVVGDAVAPERVVPTCVEHVLAAVGSAAHAGPAATPAQGILAQLRAAQRALTKDITRSQGAAAAGLAAMRSGDFSAAVWHFTVALRLAPAGEAATGQPQQLAAVWYTHRATALLGAGEPRAAATDAREAIVLAPLYAKAWERYSAATDAAATTVSSSSAARGASRKGVARLQQTEAVDKVEGGEDGTGQPPGLSTIAQRLRACDPEDAAAELAALQFSRRWAQEDGCGDSATAPTAASDGADTRVWREGSASGKGGRCLETSVDVNRGDRLLVEQPVAAARRLEWCAHFAVSRCCSVGAPLSQLPNFG
jgi:hypothetical protein